MTVILNFPKSCLTKLNTLPALKLRQNLKCLPKTLLNMIKSNWLGTAARTITEISYITEEEKQEKDTRQALKKLRRLTIYRFATEKELDKMLKTSPSTV
ncbi:hypothetical protein RO3G_04709 [Rhizopus delemar RA 99-880]|uniref:Uncharacterized protein n=1 Tax=Rhizopus delemar (strain RA 99-880 / ATCC MYA-4621 / FGSC 9543 / NRRL 43880) TaxID=246409 RepID=I1BUX4_RHIO9|nr:hypothetical protein RO3G_04709 [Rhizopus delemar RA 99-880]|eukprot:EIE80004.1 hypothetical protein RO3G_04709 [Rhizopus delemar RA 99-880]